jgi:hypothetical protein
MPSKKPAITVRASEAKKATWEQAAKARGISLAQLLELATDTLLASETSGVTAPTIGKVLKGSEVDHLLLTATDLKQDTPGRYDKKRKPLTLAEGTIWLPGKSANGTQQTLTAIAMVDPVMLTRMRDTDSIYGLYQAQKLYAEILTLPGFTELSEKGQDKARFRCWSEARSPDAETWKAYLEDLKEDLIAAKPTPVAFIPELPQLPQVATATPQARVAILTIDMLVSRFQDPGSRTALTNVGGAKMNREKIVRFTSSKDPEDLAWVPMDASRETWVVATSEPVATPV